MRKITSQLQKTLQFSELQTDRHDKRLEKLPSRPALTATVLGERNRLLYVIGVITKVRYFIDTGGTQQPTARTRLKLTGGNGKQIATYGRRYVYSNVDLHEHIGIDLLQHHDLLIDT